jgi:hypothetical protein
VEKILNAGAQHAALSSSSSSSSCAQHMHPHRWAYLLTSGQLRVWFSEPYSISPCQSWLLTRVHGLQA